MDNKEYNLYCDFDIEKHKSTYFNYLEVCIHPDGTIHYAIPSHTDYLANYVCKMYNMTKEEFHDFIQQDSILVCYYLEYMLVKSKICLVWNDRIVYDKLTLQQVASLKNLQNVGLLSKSVILSRKGHSDSIKGLKLHYMNHLNKNPKEI